MANSLAVCYDGSGGDSGSLGLTYREFNQNSPITANDPNEAPTECLNRSTGSLSNLWINVITNAIAASTTVSLRKNEANGNQNVSVGANTTGTFTDTTHTDAVSSGDKCDVGFNYTNSGGFDPAIVSAIFAATTNTVTRAGGTDDSIYSAASTTYYRNPIGGGFGVKETSEPQCKSRMRKAMTVKNYALYFFSNSNANAATWRSRKNGANGVMTISITASTTGWFEDTTHSDSVAAGDDYNYSFVTGAGSVSCNPMIAFADYVSTSQDGILSCSYDALTTINTSTTEYWGLAGRLKAGSTTETNTQVAVGSAYTFSELTINVNTNGITNTSTITLRAGGASAGVSASIGASTTGVFSDSINTYASASTDLMNYQLVTASTGTSMKISHISVWTNLTPAAAAVTGFPQNFKNLPERPGAPKIKSQNLAPTFGI